MSSDHQSRLRALLSRVRGHSTVGGPLHSQQAQERFSRVIPGRGKDAYTIRCCCSCAIPLLPLSATIGCKEGEVPLEGNFRLLLSLPWTPQIPLCLLVNWLLVFTQRGSHVTLPLMEKWHRRIPYASEQLHDRPFILHSRVLFTRWYPKSVQ